MWSLPAGPSASNQNEKGKDPFAEPYSDSSTSSDPGFDSSTSFILLIKRLSCRSLGFTDQKTDRVPRRAERFCPTDLALGSSRLQPLTPAVRPCAPVTRGRAEEAALVPAKTTVNKEGFAPFFFFPCSSEWNRNFSAVLLLRSSWHVAFIFIFFFFTSTCSTTSHLRVKWMFSTSSGKKKKKKKTNPTEYPRIVLHYGHFQTTCN